MRVSIVTPTYNQAHYLEATMLSILSQQCADLQYVVVDGGSTDGSQEIIHRHEDRLAWWASEKDSGMYDAITKGFAHTDGEIMGWQNSDDVYLPWTLQLVTRIFEQFPQVEWLTSAWPITIDPDGLPINTVPRHGFSRQGFLAGDYLVGAGWEGVAFVAQDCTFWRRSLWDKVGGLDTSLKYAGDFELWAKFFRHARLWTVTVPLSTYRKQPDQKSLVGYEQYMAEAVPVMRREAGALPSPRVQKWRMRLIKGCLAHPVTRPLRRRIFEPYPLIDYQWSTDRWRLREITPGDDFHDDPYQGPFG